MMGSTGHKSSSEKLVDVWLSRACLDKGAICLREPQAGHAQVRTPEMRVWSHFWMPSILHGCQ